MTSRWPVSSIPAFMAQADAAVMKAIPGARICSFGHMGDGNIHYNISQPIGADKDQFIGRWREINAIVHGIVLSYNGSISAEHGIGQLKRDELAHVRRAIEIRPDAADQARVRPGRDHEPRQGTEG